MRFYSRLFKSITSKLTGKSRDNKPSPASYRHRQKPHKGVIHLGNDPLDPYGDGTIRAGDPLFNLMTGGRAMISNHREDGNWEVETIPDDDEKS